jgi:hypothetical protein
MMVRSNWNNPLELTRTFSRAAILTTHNSGYRTAAEVTTWLSQQQSLTRVMINFNVNKGHARTVRLRCRIADPPTRFQFGLAYVAPQGLLFVDTETPVSLWQEQNPDCEIVFERVMSYAGRQREIWFLYRWVSR